MACGISLAVVPGLSYPEACGILVSPPGIELSSSALQDGFLTTGPPRKSIASVLYITRAHSFIYTDKYMGDKGKL